MLILLIYYVPWTKYLCESMPKLSSSKVRRLNGTFVALNESHPC